MGGDDLSGAAEQIVLGPVVEAGYGRHGNRLGCHRATVVRGQHYERLWGRGDAARRRAHRAAASVAKPGNRHGEGLEAGRARTAGYGHGEEAGNGPGRQMPVTRVALTTV